MKTIGDLSLKDNEKIAIREAARMLKERFPVRDVILSLWFKDTRR